MDYTRIVSSIDASQQHSQIVVNSTLFDFSRISGQGLPLISALMINSVIDNLNGVDVGCTGMGASETVTTISTIKIINESYLGTTFIRTAIM